MKYSTRNHKNNLFAFLNDKVETIIQNQALIT